MNRYVNTQPYKSKEQAIEDFKQDVRDNTDLIVGVYIEFWAAKPFDRPKLYKSKPNYTGGEINEA